MSNYNNLLQNISEQYSISRGKGESCEEWKSRLIYSICGIMAYTSLWDIEDDESVSIEHLKIRISTVFDDYKELYPEVIPFFSLESRKPEDEICNIFLKSGVVYHCLRHISPSVKRSCKLNNITMSRGLSIDEIKNISGLVFYDISNDDKTDISDVVNMFGLSKLDLHRIWKSITDTVSWSKLADFEMNIMNIKYLRLNLIDRNEYWADKPDKTGKISLLKTGMRGSPLYFLYRYCNNSLEISSLPHWMIEDCNYRLISNACLFEYGALPPIEYHNDGEVTNVLFNYLPPPAELNLMKLYSWPDQFRDFRRKFATNVFYALKSLLETKGYTFKEE